MRGRLPGSPFLRHDVILLLLLLPLGFVLAGSRAQAQEASGRLEANGDTGELRYATAFEVDSLLEPGYLDVRVVLADRELPESDLRSDDRLAALTHDEGLVALVVRLDPDAKALSATPYHPSLTALVTSNTELEWRPSAYDENVAGRVWTDGTVREFNQSWSYEVTFSAPIVLDPEAQTVDGR